MAQPGLPNRKGGGVALARAFRAWLKPRAPDRFANHRTRMLNEAQRERTLDLAPNDVRQVRHNLEFPGNHQAVSCLL